MASTFKNPAFILMRRRMAGRRGYAARVAYTHLRAVRYLGLTPEQEQQARTVLKRLHAMRKLG